MHSRSQMLSQMHESKLPPDWMPIETFKIDEGQRRPRIKARGRPVCKVEQPAEDKENIKEGGLPDCELTGKLHFSVKKDLAKPQLFNEIQRMPFGAIEGRHELNPMVPEFSPKLGSWNIDAPAFSPY